MANSVRYTVQNRVLPKGLNTSRASAPAATAQAIAKAEAGPPAPNHAEALSAIRTPQACPEAGEPILAAPVLALFEPPPTEPDRHQDNSQGRDC